MDSNRRNNRSDENDRREENWFPTAAGIAAAGAFAGLLYMAFKSDSDEKNHALPHSSFSSRTGKQIRVVTSAVVCERVVAELKAHCANYNVLGFDCEWIQASNCDRPVALLQLASREGLCALFRLCRMPSIPACLRDLLNNPKIIKVGVVPDNDAERLRNDYGLVVRSTLDLRFLAVRLHHPIGGLAALSKSVLGKELSKPLSVRLSDWETNTLSGEQLEYAAEDALRGLHIFMKLAKMYADSGSFWDNRDLTALLPILEPYFNKKFQSTVHTYDRLMMN